MAPKKSIFRQPGAKHFQLVHRSQRDPLIHDPDANQHVLKPFERENIKKGKDRAELEAALAPEDIEHDSRTRVGEAALYGVYYDDTQYDYLQHLRPIGVQEDGVDSILVEAPFPRNKKHLAEDLQLPHTAFASVAELPRNYESQQAIPESIAGFKPDMDPHLRQTLDALDEDAFVDDELGDDFFMELVQEGERRSDEDPGFEFREDGLEDGNGSIDRVQAGPDENAPWEERFAFFKQSQNKETTGQSDDEFASEAGDTVSELPNISVIGGKRRRRRKGTSQASGYSMSSLSMYRNEALQTLDERFEQLMHKEYDDEDSALSDKEDDSDEAPDLITSRDDFEAMMNEFMTEYEILGNKLRPRLPGETGAEKLDLLRSSMGRDERVIQGQEDSEDETDVMVSVDIENNDRWDCETILSTYSNLENHPRLIHAREGRPTTKIHLHPKTGLPTLEAYDSSKQRNRAALQAISELSDESDEGLQCLAPPRCTITRPRDESKEDKKLRKDAVKAEKQNRRVAKKTLKEKFEAEMQAQKKSVEARTKGRTRRL
ncbi:Low temperature viability domain containing protein [Amanita muscaria]